MKKILSNIVIAIAMTLSSGFAIASFQEDVNYIKTQLPKETYCESCSVINNVNILSYDDVNNEVVFSLSIISSKSNLMNLMLPLNSLEIVEAKINDNENYLLMRRDYKLEYLYGAVPKGESKITFKAKILENKIPLNFPNANVTSLVDASKLNLSQVGNSLYLVKAGTELTSNNKKDTRVKNFILSSEPIFEVTRNLKLGKTWNLETTVTTLFNGTQDYIKTDNLIKIPLLPSERVISDDVKIEDGFIIVNLDGRDNQSWSSIIESKSQIAFNSVSENVLQNIIINNEKTDWLFSIKLNNNQIKNNNVELWPTDSLVVNFNLPKSKIGNFNVVKSVILEQSLEKEEIENTWRIEIESSLGGNFTIDRGEDKSKILEVHNQDSPINFRDDSGKLTFSNVSGNNIVKIVTTEQRKPKFIENNTKWNFGVPTYNYTFRVYNKVDRWVIWTGGDMVKPSVLLLGYLLLVIIFSFILSKIHSIFNGLTWALILFGLSNMPLLFIVLMILAMVLVGNRNTALSNGKIDISNKENIAKLSKIIVACAVYAVSVLIFSAGLGLVGSSNSFIVSPFGGSSLTWMTDVYTETNAYMFSLPKLYFKVFMFIWSIWLAFIIVKLITIVINFIKKINE